MRAVSSGMTDAAIDAYARVLSTPQRRAAILELYRSGDFSELAAYDGQLAALGVPALVLWGGDDPFSPLAGAHRLAQELRRQPSSSSSTARGTSSTTTRRERCAAEIVSFLGRLARA